MSDPDAPPDAPAPLAPYREGPLAPAPQTMSLARRTALGAFSVGTGVGYGVAARIAFGHPPMRGEWLSLMSLSFLFAVPLAMGAIQVFRYPYGYPLRVGRAIGGALLASVLTLAITSVFALEGSICIIMASPIFLVMALLGSLFAHAIRQRLELKARYQGRLLGVAAVLPLLLSPLEHLTAPPTEQRIVRNEVTIHASPSAVWREIASVRAIAPSELPWSLSHAIGLPRPIEATLDVHEVGGVRMARFDRGLVFREEVTEWSPGRRLAFAIHAAQVPAGALDEHVAVGTRTFDVLEGTYELEARGPREVRLRLWSRQRLGMRFNRYASLWTDFVMHDLQRVILQVVAARAEAHPEE